MKNTAITRIVIYSLLIVILTGALVAGLTFDSISMTFTTSGVLKNAIAADSRSFDLDEVDEIVILWVNGSVELSSWDTDRISYETRRSDSSPETVYKLSGGCLTIAFSSKSTIFGKVTGKNLSLILPYDWKGTLVQIEAVSANVSINCLDVKKLKLENVSGQIIGNYICAEELSVDTVSGDMDFQGSFGKISIDGVSADCALRLNASCPVNFDCTSGDLKLYLPTDCGFQLWLDSVSGQLTTSLTYSMVKDHYSCEGTSPCKIDMDSVSGDIFIATWTPDPDTCDHVWDEGVLYNGTSGDPNLKTMQYTCKLCGKVKIEDVVSGAIYTISCMNERTENLLVEPLAARYAAGDHVILRTEIIIDADMVLDIYLPGSSVPEMTIIGPSEGDDCWEYIFSMPSSDIIIDLRIVDGI